MQPLFQEAAKRIQPFGTLWDVGCGIYPRAFGPVDRHVCIEPYGPYADKVLAKGFPVVRATALDALRDPSLKDPDTIQLIDVIEHMEKREGEETVRLALERARRQVVIFTPLGFIPQTEDAWGLGGEHWQTHRSGWMPTEFPDWECLVDERFHEPRIPGGGAFFAIWTRQ